MSDLDQTTVAVTSVQRDSFRLRPEESAAAAASGAAEPKEQQTAAAQSLSPLEGVDTRH